MDTQTLIPFLAGGGAMQPPTSQLSTESTVSLGLSLVGFQHLVQLLGGRDVLSGVTTASLKDDFIKPLTGDAKSSYAVLAASDPGRSMHVGKPTRFISHSYAYAFLDVVDTLVEYEASLTTPGVTHFYYFDLLVVNQHGQAGVVPFEVLRDEFGSNVQRIGHTLLVLNWGETLLPLTSAWCAYELFCTNAQKHVKLTILIPPNDRKRFHEALADDFKTVYECICNVKVQDAKAREKEDHDNIHRVIRESIGGYDAVNEGINRGLIDELMRVGHEELLALPEAERFLSPLARSYLKLLSRIAGSWGGRTTDISPFALAGAIYSAISGKHSYDDASDRTRCMPGSSMQPLLSTLVTPKNCTISTAQMQACVGSTTQSPFGCS